jgi:hypothetical protein
MKFKTQLQMFNWIWENRPHVSELSGKPLYPKSYFRWHWQFLHVLGKQRYPDQKLNPDNIMLALPDEHEKQEQYPKFKEKQQELKTLVNASRVKRIT